MSEKKSGFVQKYISFLGSIESAVTVFFRKVGRINAEHSCLVISCCVFVAFLTMLGFASFTFETDNAKLFSPDGTDGPRYKEYIRAADHYGAIPRIEQFIMTSKNGENILNADTLIFWRKIHDDLYALKSGSITYDHICLMAGSSCHHTSILDYYGTDAEIRAMNHTQLEDAISVPPLTEGELALLAGGVVKDSHGHVSKVEGFRTILYALNSDEVKDDAFDWEGEFLDYFEDLESDKYDFYYYAERSGEDVAQDAVMGDVALYFIGFLLMFVYLAFSLGKADVIQARVLLAVVGFFTILMSILMSFGFSSALGLYFSSLSSFLPLLILGVGVDNCFILIAAFEGTDPKKPVADRISEAQGSVGVNITLAAACGSMAFLLGSTTAIPAMQNFCFYAFFAVVFCYCNIMTLFMAFMAIDTRRLEANRISCLPCFKLKRKEGQDNSAFKPSKATLMMRKVYGPFILRRPVSIVVLLFFLFLFAFGIYGIADCETGLDVSDVLPSDSYLVKYIDCVDDYFSQIGVEVQVVFTEEAQYHEKDVFQAMVKLPSLLNKMVVMTDGTVDAWITPFKAELPTYAAALGITLDADGYPTSKVDYYHLLDQFRKDSKYSSYDNNIVRADDAYGTIVTCRYYGRYVFTEKISDQVDNMLDGRDELEEIMKDLPKSLEKTFIYGTNDATLEMEVIVIPETVQNLVLASIVVFIFSLVLLVKPSAGFIVLGVIIVVDCGLFAVMKLWDISLNTLTMIMLVMAIGFSVDYIVHVNYGYMVSVGSKKERVIKSLSSLGSSVINGGFTTFLAVFVMAFSSSKIFITFFKMAFALVVLGLAGGMILQPVVLSFVGPASLVLEDKLGHAPDASAVADQKKAVPVPEGSKELEDIQIKDTNSTDSAE
eukprot:GCRY01000571.1.p1 GENE.GCRY01000571.1~~GCRY01000571.1.p1  ORF type:complete len:888 (+),score=232.61 GCRY01000571.1:157-2820(+)